jgi:hypothetical protein
MRRRTVSHERRGCGNSPVAFKRQILCRTNSMTKWDAMKSRIVAATPGPWQTCPVCGGNGLRPNGFYSQTTGAWGSSTTGTEICRSCEGKGYICGQNFHAREDMELLMRVVEAARKEVTFQKGNPRSKIFRHDVMIHGGIQAQCG